jgi:hypothetical protein
MSIFFSKCYYLWRCLSRHSRRHSPYSCVQHQSAPLSLQSKSTSSWGRSWWRSSTSRGLSSLLRHLQSSSDIARLRMCPSGVLPFLWVCLDVVRLVWCLRSASRVAIEKRIVYDGVGITAWHDMLVTPTSCGWRVESLLLYWSLPRPFIVLDLWCH